MKTKLLFLSALMLLAVVGSFAQITTTGMAIQGIARNATNNAITSSTINLKFTVYYGVTQLLNVTAEVTTDAFGVFSYILNLTDIENQVFYDNQLFLKIEKISPGSEVVISDEILNFVPYAISARNGVPTGSIMPFIGTIVPSGWWLCDGSTLPSTAKELIKLLGSRAPNLQGMFLRGTGTSPVNSQAGPALKATQAEELKSHLHASGTLITDSKGGHNHSSDGTNNRLVKTDGLFTVHDIDNSINEVNLGSATTIPMDGAHTHIISGSTATTGGTETRPVNYGVNYIIKL